MKSSFPVIDGSYVDEENILDLVLKDYRVDVRPQIKARSPVIVKFDVRLKTLNSLVCKIHTFNLTKLFLLISNLFPYNSLFSIVGLIN